MKLITYTTQEQQRIPYMTADGDPDDTDRIIGRLLREVKERPLYVQIWQLNSTEPAKHIGNVAI